MRPLFRILLVCLLAVPGAAHAACSSPSGNAGKVIYDADHSMLSYCDGTNWIAMGRPVSGGLPTGCPNIGDVCSDGTVYAGQAGTGGRMYVPRCDAGMSWNGSNCTGTRSLLPWNNGNTSGYVDTSVVNDASTDGESYTAILITEDSDSGTAGAQPHQAAQYCADLSVNGHNDWYLPAQDELNTLYTNRAVIGNFDTSPTYYWSSTEYTNANARIQRFSNGNQSQDGKSIIYLVRCARTDGLIGHWKLDETSGTTAVDSSGYGNNGTLDSDAAFVSGKVNNAVLLDSDDDSVNIPNESDFDFERTDAFSLAAWFYRLSNDGTEDDIIEKFDGDGYWLYYPTASDDLYFGMNDSGLALSIYAEDIMPGEWHHVVATYDGSSNASGATLYINGVEHSTIIAEDDLSGSILNNSPLTIGNEAPSAYAGFNGKIDDVRIYNHALSATEVGELYCTSTPGKVIYNEDSHVMQFCSDKGVHAMGPPGDGGAGCTNPAGIEGTMIYNNDHNVAQYCEGDTWIAIGK